jgi:hypothetical protein
MSGRILKLLAFSCLSFVASFPASCQLASTAAVKSEAKGPEQIHWIRYNDSAEGA